MDLDGFVARRRPDWQRLNDLASRRRLRPHEVDELVHLYQRASTDLSTLRSGAPDPALVSSLSSSIARARAAVTGAHTSTWSDVGRFFAVSFPAAAYRAGRWWLVTGLLFIAVVTLVAWWIAANPDVRDAIATPDEVSSLVNQDFADYYTSSPASSFAAQVWTNNALLAAMVLVLGAMLCLPAVYVLWTNALNTAAVAGLMASAGRLDVFFGLIAPHGLLELTAVFLAAAAGMRLGWCIVAPGGRPRAVAMAEEGRAAATIAIGLVLVLFVSGVIEAFVTPSGLPTGIRIGIGVSAWVGFIAYVVVLGGRAVRAGYTGDVTGSGTTTDLAPYAA